jgi:gluconate 2-dehydrogenase gamma chain
MMRAGLPTASPPGDRAPASAIAGRPAPSADAPRGTAMTGIQRRTLHAAALRILPSDDGPGALESGAAGYAEWRIAEDGARASTSSFLDGLDLLDRLAAGMFDRGFPECSAEEQDAILSRVDEIPHPTTRRFFRRLVNLTLAGFLCAPSYGGNRGRAGWRFIGFSPRPPTFGAEGERG